ncbi:hypothetical protein [uncultured Sphingomonas sp.]|nr:hypothetical protein [uncultured Sphingomonas sp.]
MNDAVHVPADNDAAASHKAMIAMALIIAVAMIGGLAALLLFSL